VRVAVEHQAPRQDHHELQRSLPTAEAQQHLAYYPSFSLESRLYGGNALPPLALSLSNPKTAMALSTNDASQYSDPCFPHTLSQPFTTFPFTRFDYPASAPPSNTSCYPYLLSSIHPSSSFPGGYRINPSDDEFHLLPSPAIGDVEPDIDSTYSSSSYQRLYQPSDYVPQPISSSMEYSIRPSSHPSRPPHRRAFSSNAASEWSHYSYPVGSLPAQSSFIQTTAIPSPFSVQTSLNIPLAAYANSFPFGSSPNPPIIVAFPLLADPGLASSSSSTSLLPDDGDLSPESFTKRLRQDETGGESSTEIKGKRRVSTGESNRSEYYEEGSSEGDSETEYMKAYGSDGEKRRGEAAEGTKTKPVKEKTDIACDPCRQRKTRSVKLLSHH
jgi:hypothetical protein